FGSADPLFPCLIPQLFELIEGWAPSQLRLAFVQFSRNIRFVASMGDLSILSTKIIDVNKNFTETSRLITIKKI
ncbi:hypothetical protein OYT88_19505, partial [Sporolactobacillus sp. CQH2019]|uniref:hypothetical protein n=1 Tax=Sporolactobacillus sp. CQH2019 TaxID=3023512 RepID=UPI002368CA4B